MKKTQKKFQFVNKNGGWTIAWLSVIEKNTLGVKDPEWFGSGADNGGPWEWLTYRGTDGGVWKTYIHAEYDSGRHMCNLKIESRPENGNGSNSSFQIVDPSNLKWDIQVKSPVPLGQEIEFIMTQID